MAKVNAPLLSLGASGSIAHTLTYFPWKGINVIRSWVKPSNPNTTAQSTQRGYMKTIVTLIHTAMALASSPLSALDTAAYALDAATESTPRTWFNQAVMQGVMSLKAGKQAAIYRAATVTPSTGGLALVLKWTKTGSNDITAANCFYGTSKSALISSVAAVVAGSAITSTLTGLAAGQKYYMQVRATTHADFALTQSGIYFGTPN